MFENDVQLSCGQSDGSEKALGVWALPSSQEEREDRVVLAKEKDED